MWLVVPRAQAETQCSTVAEGTKHTALALLVAKAPVLRCLVRCRAGIMSKRCTVASSGFSHTKLEQGPPVSIFYQIICLSVSVCLSLSVRPPCGTFPSSASASLRSDAISALTHSLTHPPTSLQLGHNQAQASRETPNAEPAACQQ